MHTTYGRLKCLFIDHDGTLVDSENYYFEFWCKALNNYGVCLNWDTYRRFGSYGSTTERCIRLCDYYNLGGLENDLYISRQMIEFSFLQNKSFPLRAGMLSFIYKMYNANIDLFIVTGASSKASEATIKHNNLGSFIKSVISADTVRSTKPSPDVYLEALKQSNYSINQCLAIEDSRDGVVSAISAGIQCIAYPNSYTVTDDLSLAYDIVQNVVELEKKILRVCKI